MCIAFQLSRSVPIRILCEISTKISCKFRHLGFLVMTSKLSLSMRRNHQQQSTLSYTIVFVSGFICLRHTQICRHHENTSLAWVQTGKCEEHCCCAFNHYHCRQKIRLEMKYCANSEKDCKNVLHHTPSSKGLLSMSCADLNFTASIPRITWFDRDNVKFIGISMI